MNSLDLSLISSWGLFPQVFAKTCVQCAGADLTGPSLVPDQQQRKASRVRKVVSDAALASAPSYKKRQIEKNRAATIDLTSDHASSIAPTKFDAPAGFDAAKVARSPAAGLPSDQEWIHVRRLSELLGSVAVLRPCGHSLSDLDAIPVMTVLKGSNIMIVLGEDATIAMKEDVPLDHAWPSSGATLFGTLAAAKNAGQVVVLTTLVYYPLKQDENGSGMVHVQFDVFLHRGMISETLSVVEGSRLSAIDIEQRQDLVHSLFPPATASASSFTQNAIFDLYMNLTPSPTSAEPPAAIQPDELLPQLLPFQRRSVSWLLARESVEVSPETGLVDHKAPTASERLPFSWEQVTAPNGQDSMTFFINRLTGTICIGAAELVADEPEPRGGILAEEMGLGKTVEMLALILLNRRKTVDKSGGEYDLVKKMSAAHLVNGADRKIVNPEQLVPGPLTVSDFTTDGSSAMPGYDHSTPEHLVPSGATLIITPPSILHQWASEIENHAPTLKVYVYLEEQHKTITAKDLAEYDVVLTTYPVLAKEINYAQEYDRPRRYERQYVPRQSPFVKIHWWRVCLDEAQMIEGTTVSQAAAMTLIIPRVMSWAISGTPIRRHIEDLHSLLRFLSQEPIASNKRLWKFLTAFKFRSTFIASYRRILHRYAKRDVVDELRIPKQHRLLYGVSFTDIERANYLEVWEECLAECEESMKEWVIDEGKGKTAKARTRINGRAQKRNAIEVGDEDAGKKRQAVDGDKLQAWLVRLRQTCCHPQISTWSKESLGTVGTGGGRKNVRTIDAVLDIMLQRTFNLLNAKEKALLLCKIKRAILSAASNVSDRGVSEAIALFEEVEAKIHDHVQLWRARVEDAISAKREKSLSFKGKDKMTTAVDDGDIGDHVSSLGSSRGVSHSSKEPKDSSVSIHPSVRFRDWQEQHHKILFFMASTYSEFGLVEKEAEYYSRATSIREEMLAAPQEKFNKVLGLVLACMGDVSLDKSQASIPGPRAMVASGGNGSGAMLPNLITQFKYLVDLMNNQRPILEDWRSRLLDILTEPLSDDYSEDQSRNAGGHGLQDTLDRQNMAEAYLHHYGRLLYFRKDLLIGAPSVITSYVQKAKDYKDHARMVDEREKRARRLLGASYMEEETTIDQELEQKIYSLIKPDLAFTFKTVRVMLDTLATARDSASADDKGRAASEVKKLKSLMDEQERQIDILEKELERLRLLASARSLYYHQLKGISDTVIAIDSKNPQEDLIKCMDEEIALVGEISNLTSKQRYLQHIAESMAKESNDGVKDKSDGSSHDDSHDDNQERLCLICSESYHYGLMTECGHIFCETCLTEWTKTHATCPSCKSHVAKIQLKSVSMAHSSSFKTEAAQKPSSMAMDGVDQALDLTQFHAALSSSTTSVASAASTSGALLQVPAQIQQVKIQTGYGSKIDSIVRHIRFLIQEDPTVKCLVFSQWSNLLRLMTDSLTINQIGFVRLDGASNKSAVHEFKTNKAKSVFMLHAKSQSAGLTLLQATHVFICEPLVNPALQAQAVSRVHRIGQTKETFVHYYLLKDTVEVPCFELFERNSATATGSSHPSGHHPMRDNGAEAPTTKKGSMIASKKRPLSDSSQAGNGNLDGSLGNGSGDSWNDSTVNGGSGEAPSTLDSATVTTASASADSQRNSHHGEQVKEDDLRYCFSAQTRMAESLTRIMAEATLANANKDNGIDKNTCSDKSDIDGDVLMSAEVYEPTFGDPDAFLEGNTGQLFVDEDGAMTFA